MPLLQCMHPSHCNRYDLLRAAAAIPGNLTWLQGVANLVEVGKRAKVKQIVLVSSIGADEPFFPLNLLWGVSFNPVRVF